MRELGYVEGKNLVLEWRVANGKREWLPELAAEFVQLKVDVIVVSASSAALAAQKTATAIPILFAAVNDPVSLGLIKSLARPGGSVTGRANITDDLGPKRVELLLAMVPKVSRMAVLVDSNSVANARAAEILLAAAQKRRVTVVRVEAGTPQEIETAFSTMVRENAGALIVLFTPLFNQQRGQIAELAAKHRLPTIAGDRGFAEAGCLMSYGASLADDFHRLATYVDKIFKGAKPSYLPVEQPTKFELIINGKTVKALSLAIPQSMLLGAEVIGREFECLLCRAPTSSNGSNSVDGNGPSAANCDLRISLT
jgi:putative ABC transport system substrate-binding protein